MPDHPHQPPPFSSTYSMLLASVSFMITWHLGKSTERWWEARKALQTATQCALRGMQLAAAHGAPSATLDALLTWSITWLRCLHAMVLLGEDAPRDTLELLSPSQAVALHGTAAPHQLAQLKMACLLRDTPDSSGLAAKACEAVDTLVMLSTQCLPHAVSILATGYCEFFLILYAFAPTIASPTEASLDYLRTKDGSHVKAHTTIIVTCVMWLVQYTALNLLLLGTDEVAAQLELPFHMLPLDALLAKTERAMRRAPTLVTAMMEADDADGSGTSQLGVPPGVTKLMSRRTLATPEAPLTQLTTNAIELAPRLSAPLPQRDVEAGLPSPSTREGDTERSPLRGGKLSHIR